VGLGGNLMTALRHPHIGAAYAAYLLKSIRGEAAAKIRGVSIAGFSGFSEYLTYRSNMSDAEEAVLRKLGLPPESVVLDIGANLGLFALLVVGMRSDLDVRAFEPNPETFARLTQNVLRNGRQVCCHQMALGALPGHTVFRAEKRATAISRLAYPGEATDSGDARFIEVEADTIDAYCERMRISRIRLLKIDVEGFEADVLRGARRMLEAGAVDFVYFEICPANAAAVGADAAAAARYLHNLGFDLFEPADEGALIGTIPDRVPQVTLANWLAVRRGVEKCG
jgi:FkbM family methyltransferase